MICPESLETGLEQTFRHILETRMQGMPIIHERLVVQAVDFRWWDGHCLGVLITPWFLNLMLLPAEGDDWCGLRVGEKVDHVFPSGRYEFIIGEEEALGRYQMCSLFSPVFEFADQEAAVATARAALAAIMDEENRDTSGFAEQIKAFCWCGEPEAAEAVSGVLPAPRRLTRRTFLTGGQAGKEVE